MGDWLGTGAVAARLREYRPFREARAFVRCLKLKSGSEWLAFCKGEMPRLGRRPADIPAKPSQTYADKGWAGMGNWLGTGSIAPWLREYRPFREARAFARSLELKSTSEWREFCQGQMLKKGKLPHDIPTNAYKTYVNKGWKSMGDWLGTGTIAPWLRKYRSFPEARTFVRKLKLKTRDEWIAFTKGRLPRLGRLPEDVPTCPAQTYSDKGWKGYGDWLGTGTIAPRLREYRPFRDARTFVRNLKLKNRDEWVAFTKGRLPKLGCLPEDIPACPNQTYVNKGWAGMGDWLGTGTIAPRLREYRPFREARAFVRKFKLNNNNEWLAYTKGRLPRLGRLPKDIPAYPNQTYADKGWKGMGDWLGTGVKREPKQKRPG